MIVPSPVETLLALNGGESAVLTTPSVGTSTDYDPASEVDFAPSGPQSTDIVGIWSVADENGLNADEVAVFLVGLTALPHGELPGLSTVLLNGITYRVSRIKRRVWMGQTDGYALYLSA